MFLSYIVVVDKFRREDKPRGHANVEWLMVIAFGDDWEAAKFVHEAGSYSIRTLFRALKQSNVRRTHRTL